MFWDSGASKGWKKAKMAKPTTKIMSIMVNWKYALRAKANTCAEANAKVCINTMLSQNQNLLLQADSRHIYRLNVLHHFAGTDKLLQNNSW